MSLNWLKPECIEMGNFPPGFLHHTSEVISVLFKLPGVSQRKGRRGR